MSFNDAVQTVALAYFYSSNTTYKDAVVAASHLTAASIIQSTMCVYGVGVGVGVVAWLLFFMPVGPRRVACMRHGQGGLVLLYLPVGWSLFMGLFVARTQTTHTDGTDMVHRRPIADEP